MSVSSDGILFFGLCWDIEEGLRGVLAEQREEDGEDEDEENEEDDDDDDDELLDVLCRHLGGPAQPVWDDVAKAHTGDIRAYWRERDAFIAERVPVTIEDVTHCSYDYPMYALAVEVTKTRASRGDPVRVGDFAVPDGWEASLRVACEALGIDYDRAVGEGRLGWWLTSVYG